MASLPKCNTDDDSIFCSEALEESQTWGEENELGFGYIRFKGPLRQANGDVKKRVRYFGRESGWRCYLSVERTQSHGIDKSTQEEVMKKEEKETEDHTLRIISGKEYMSIKETNKKQPER